MAVTKEQIRLQELAHKYLLGTLTLTEQLEFDQWFNQVAELPHELASIEHNYEVDLFAKINRQIANQQPKVRRLWFRYAAAAVVLISFGVATYFYWASQSSQYIETQGQISPGTIGATLTLGNGKKIRLAAVGNGELANEAGVKIVKRANGELTYHIDNATSLDASINTLNTSKGETYAVVLPDGSKVWLNAASSLKYPANFSNLKERKVELTGEGYFEVAKAAVPFLVQTPRQLVTVLGTHFNINTYADEPLVKTTLLEGSVKVSLAQGAKSIMLKPGQQAIQQQTTLTINPSTIDADDVIAWKNGKFVFVKEDIESIMRKLGRWYNVEVVIESLPVYNAFSGSMSRFDHIAQVLNKIEATNKVHFKVQGRRIIVMR